MCLAFPGRIVELNADFAKVDFGGGTTKDVNVSMVDARVGDYVIVHAGCAIQVMSEEEARKTIELWNEFVRKAEG